MLHLLLILVALFLILLNGFFVAAEFSIVKIRSTHIKSISKQYGLRGRILAKIHQQLDAYLSATQLGITLASLGLGWIGEPAFADLLKPLLHLLGIYSDETISAIAFIVAFLFISYLHIVVGELAPKSLAIRLTQTVALWTAVPLYSFYWMMYPFIWLLNKSANFLLKLCGITTAFESEANYSPDELKIILSASHTHGSLKKEEAEILDNVLDFTDLKVADIMRAADELIALSLQAPINDNLEIIRKYRFSRYPIYEDNPQQITGILHVKDVLLNIQENAAISDLHPFVRPVVTVSTETLAFDLFKQFRDEHTHFAIVNNAYGVVVGFVTFDNILSVMLGQIGDEFINQQEDWEITKDGALMLKGNVSLYALEKALNLELPYEENTVSGLILSKLERLPSKGEYISFDEFDIEVIKVKGPKILLVKVYPKTE